jgi:hypothetical protein
MPDLGTATQNFVDSQIVLNKQAAKVEKAREAQDEAEARAKKEWEDWQEDPSEANQKAYAKALTKQNTAIGNAKIEENALRAALIAFTEAQAAYITALLQAIYR